MNKQKAANILSSFMLLTIRDIFIESGLITMDGWKEKVANKVNINDSFTDEEK